MAMPHQDPGTSTNSPNLPIFGHTHPRTHPAQFMYMYSPHKHMLSLPLSHLSGHPLQIPHSVPLQETARSTSPNPPGTPFSATIHYCSPLLSTLISLFNQKKNIPYPTPLRVVFPSARSEHTDPELPKLIPPPTHSPAGRPPVILLLHTHPIQYLFVITHTRNLNEMQKNK